MVLFYFLLSLDLHVLPKGRVVGHLPRGIPTGCMALHLA